MLVRAAAHLARTPKPPLRRARDGQRRKERRWLPISLSASEPVVAPLVLVSRASSGVAVGHGCSRAVGFHSGGGVVVVGSRRRIAIRVPDHRPRGRARSSRVKSFRAGSTRLVAARRARNLPANRPTVVVTFYALLRSRTRDLMLSKSAK